MSYGMTGLTTSQEPRTERGKRINAVLWRIFSRIEKARPGQSMRRRNFYYYRQQRLNRALIEAERS